MDNSLNNSVLRHMPLAYGLHKIIPDDGGRPRDLEIVDVNGKFEELTGLFARDIIGRRASEVIPWLLDGGFVWPASSGDGAQTGAPLRCERYAQALGRWFFVEGYCPEKGYCVTLFSDITEEKDKAGAAAEGERKLQRYLDFAPLGLIVVSNRAGLEEANPEACRITGYTAGELCRLNLQHLIERSSRIMALMFFKDLLTAGEAACQLQIKTKSGQTRWLTLNARTVSEDRHAIYCQDITSYKALEDDLVESELLYRTFINASNDVIYLKDENLRYVIVNNALLDQFGCEGSEIVGRTDFEFRPGDVSCQAESTDREVIGRKTGSVSKMAADGKIFEAVKFPVSIGSRKTGVGAYIRDVTERERAFDEIKYLSYHDHLTGLFNRRYFDSVLKSMNDERFMPLAVVMADVNGLKLINDSFGHTEGDALLKKAAEVITRGCRKDDISARIGGDEFVILLPNTDSTEAGKIVRRIKKLQSKVTIRQLKLSLSFGYAVKHDVRSDIELVVSEAENKMYKNKMHESATTRSKTVGIIMQTLYEKCIGETEHSNRVSRIAAAIATELGLNPEQVNQISVAGLLHDIGKIGVDERILNKPGIFTRADREEIEKHAESGWRILCNSDEYALLADYVLYHHESPDGKGYPRGIKGDSIPLESKIIAVSDAFDAMTNDRPYRKALTRDEAVSELEKNSGSQFDPEVVRIFVEKVLSGGYDI
ncbi:PAS domain S-box-containing protein/diguanylate cyclase (GGDEF) domain-containing protein/HDIG domain-containing protein [Sporobacter termitidis DSM 10068]|uniref:PAS domain S-box-containing protein/diguanylate cyclase (GGDEF) domain-containing protein/HDIG domain-containing protein n=1 Tax=Sporobacter termitidis DSM 10068 TaxID=1123282 RepID=A0A1M5YED0_9FIRM|nr:HD domain-containing phosphohydrolase [Sporobacter termitidis]SHI10249.1 PAS domain S-box-containing protein/diguanylate cyclase (GGDEF) domain-containing protein/HDIG domain-containing protein [Sporobacter termitidis DSM 10068]